VIKGTRNETTTNGLVNNLPDVVHDNAAGEALDTAGDGNIVVLKVLVTLEHLRRGLVLRNV
jgi:hypothetical protein